MAVKLRLKRMGAKKRPYYRIVAADSRSPRDGRFIETVGTYNPITVPAEVNINEEVALKWLSTGAIPTDTVRAIFSKQGIMKKFHESKNVVAKAETKKAPAKKETTNKTAKATKTTAKKTTKKVTKEA